ncbi:sister chromatid cohesion protein PDS5 [Pedosphaera parvula]|nr:sister chromatid cohesion protein PDS5 [Pedosphaera parvula]
MRSHNTAFGSIMTNAFTIMGRVFLWIVILLTYNSTGHSAESSTVVPTASAEPSLESLLNRTFPEKKLSNLGSADFKSLTPTLCNQIAVAAARELSLHTTNGAMITANTVDVLLYKSARNDTPIEAALRQLCGDNEARMELLRDLENEHLISDPRVIEPLINMLEYPGVHTAIRSEAAQTLNQLTARTFGSDGGDSWNLSEANKAQISQARQWWIRNRDHHPVFDAEVETLIKTRIATIQVQLRRDLTNYPELNRTLRPADLRITHSDPVTLVDIALDTRYLQQGIFRYRPDGTPRPAREEDYVTLSISAKFGTPPFPKAGPQISKATAEGAPPGNKEVMLNEVLPGTDIIISVKATSKGAEFIRQVHDSLATLPHAPESVDTALGQLESLKASEITRLKQLLQQQATAASALSGLVDLGADGPVIGALTNANPLIRRYALLALANPDVGEDAVAPLASLLKDDNSETRYLAAWALGRVHKQAAVTVPALKSGLEDKDAWVRHNAVEALGEFNESAQVSIPVLITAVADTNALVRAKAIATLGGLCRFNNEQDAAVVPALITVLNDQNEDVRRSAVWALGEIMNGRLGGEHPRPDGSNRTPEALGSRAKILETFEPQARILLPALIQATTDKSPAVRKAAVYALGDIGIYHPDEDAKMIAALKHALNDADKDVRGSSISALANFGAEATNVIPSLAELAKNADPSITNEIIQATSQIKAAAYKQKLDSILKEKYPRLDQVAGPLTKTDKTQWSIQTNFIPGIKPQPSFLKRAVFQVPMNYPEQRLVDIDIVAFKAPKSGEVWVGWDMDFYVETDSEILGAMLTPWGDVQWHTNLNSQPSEADLAAAIDQFQKKVSHSKLKGESEESTIFRDAVPHDFLWLLGTGQNVMPKFLDATVNRGSIRLDLENPESGQKASIWIDAKTRKLLKAQPAE